ncbi:RXLR domain-containing protein WY [Phytophthora infestans]|uniref:RXLR domain-containing protein WY n=1 Tax=Phytophthora infestans TaxID=4787 RepID=A0A833TGG0_PHYIN|nr:RXLR domain-containing protein WY [Phytophthora infestans]
MVCQYALLLVFVVLFVSSAEPMSLRKNGFARPSGISHRSPTQNMRVAVTPRAQEHKVADVHFMVDNDQNEERGGLSKIMSLASKASPSAANKLLLGLRKNPQQVFAIMGLGKKLDNRKLLQWLRYTVEYRAKHGDAIFTDANVLSLLRKGRTDGEVRLLIHSIRESPDLDKLGKGMERSLYGEWFAKKLRPAHVKNLLAESPGSTLQVKHKSWKSMQRRTCYT